MNTNDITKINSSIDQTILYGYEEYFDAFVNLSKQKKLPNAILLSGLKGIGKSTFIYHFINYLMSLNEDNKYSIKKSTISKENLSYKMIKENTHPNFILIKNKDLEKNITIDQIRDLNKFLTKSTYSHDFKIIMIDNAENLNTNSSNALLSALEETKPNTFFFLIHDSAYKILNTIKSRCVEFKIFLNKETKNIIFKNLLDQYSIDLLNTNISENLRFDTPGNLIKYYLNFSADDSNMLINNKREAVLYFINKQISEKKYDNITFLSLLIEIFYNDLISKKPENINLIFSNYTEILKQINNMKKFNLDEKNVLISIENILKNEPK